MIIIITMMVCVNIFSPHHSTKSYPGLSHILSMPGVAHG